MVSGSIYDIKSTFLAKNICFLYQKATFLKNKKKVQNSAGGSGGRSPPVTGWSLWKKSIFFFIILDAKTVIFHEMAPYASYKAQIWRNHIYLTGSEHDLTGPEADL